METTTVHPFYLVGLSVRTDNTPGQADQAIPQLWHQFLSEQVANKILSKTSDAIYCAYTEYEGDYTKPYTVVLGCKTDRLDNIPEGMKGVAVDGGDYTVFRAKGKLEDNIVYDAWLDIWKAPVDRAYRTDFEVYDGKMDEDGGTEVKIFIGVKQLTTR